MTATLYLIRHGETTWNRVSKLQGHADSPLTLRGARQAEAMGRALAPHLEGLGYSFHASPLGRARQSAAVIADILGFDYFAIRWDDRLKEITLGAGDGYANFQNLDRDFPEAAAQRRADPWNVHYPGGESDQMVQDRVRPVLAELLAGSGIHVIVAHGVVNKILRGLYLGLANDAIFGLDRPQDVIHRFVDGRIEEIAAESVG